MTQKNQKSNCCKAEIKVEGDTTKYYVCQSCKQGCDVLDETFEWNEEDLLSDLLSERKTLLNKIVEEIEKLKEDVVDNLPSEYVKLSKEETADKVWDLAVNEALKIIKKYEK